MSICASKKVDLPLENENGTLPKTLNKWDAHCKQKKSKQLA